VWHRARAGNAARLLGTRAGALLLVLGLLGAGPVWAAKLSFEDLVANLKSPNARTRQDAAAALGKSRRIEAIAPLAALVRDPEVKVRLEVVRALRDLRGLTAVPALVTSMGDGDRKIREEAIGALVEIYSERERTTPVTRFLDLFSDEYDRSSIPPYTSVDPAVFKALATALRDEEPDIRTAAALSIGILGGRVVIKELIATLQDPEADVRGAAATAIGKVGSADDGRSVVPLLSDESTAVRNRALQAIGVLRVKEAGPTLRQMYEANRRREPGVKVLECLSRIADPTQGDLLRELIQDPDPERRRLAVEGLGRVADPQLLPAFKKDYQRERNEELRLAYSFALALLGDRAFIDSIVLGLPSRLYGNRCRRYLLEMGRELLPDLYPYLNDPDEDIRAELCDLIASLADADAIPRLQALISDPSTKVSDRANRAVERLKRMTVPREGDQ
jgi:HEAT repeat protein